LFDVSGLGSIRINELKKISRELGIDIKEEELEEMIKYADPDNDGEVSKEEFMNFMTQTK
jgi:Ca2+-binding EF-hand superfamily protein